MDAPIVWSDLNLVSLLGQGQAGQVWLATLNRPNGGFPAGEKVAVKRYKPWVLDQPGQLNRIKRELAASVKVRHPRVIESISLVFDSDNLPALVMKYYEGQTLEALLDATRSRGEHLAVTDAFKLLGALIDGVEALHLAGIHHRDLKPANVFIEDRFGLPIVMDLGVVSNFLLPEQTQTKDFLGTIRYAEPGYLIGGQFSTASDWHSVGLIGYELFFGDRFLGSEEHWAKLVFQKLSGRSPSNDDFAKQCADLTAIHGQNVAEAVFHTLNTLLFGPTHQNVRHLRKGISAEFWSEPFFEQSDGELVHGEPPRVPAFRAEPAHWVHQTHDSWESLKSARGRLTGLLSSHWEDTHQSDWSRFKEFLKSQYWNWRVEGKGDINRLDAKAIQDWSFYEDGLGDDVNHNHFEINAGTMGLFRYGYL